MDDSYAIKLGANDFDDRWRHREEVLMKVEEIENSYQLSPMQQGMLFHSLYTQQSGGYIEQIICALHESLDVSAFKRAWQRVAERHPVLRTSLRWEGLNAPLQEVH